MCYSDSGNNIKAVRTQSFNKVMNVSGGTAVMRDKEGYRGIPKAYIQGWGQGLALSFFATLLVSDEIQKDGAL